MLLTLGLLLKQSFSEFEFSCCLIHLDGKEVRNCSYYHEEYKDCKSWRGRLYNRYTYGEKLNCDHWSKAYDMCIKVKRDQDEEALDFVVEHEILRREFRLQSARANDIWEYRLFPPEDWASIPAEKHANPADSNKDKNKSVTDKLNSHGLEPANLNDIHNIDTDKSDTEKSGPKILDKTDGASDNVKKDERRLMEEIFTSKPKVNPKYDNTVQRCVIL